MIWCVDDDNTIRDIEVYTLTQTGFEAKGFADGISMLEALKNEKPELYIDFTYWQSLWMPVTENSTHSAMLVQ